MRVDSLSRRVVDFYACNPPISEQIVHTQSVAHFTRLIAVGEGRSDSETELLELAAWLHDIGCPVSRRIYGNSLPVHQECEGEKLVHEWLDASAEYTADEVAWLGHAVGGHHRLKQAQLYHFEPLFEADLIVNLIEGYYKMDQVPNFLKHMVVTATGRALFRTMFPNDI